MVLVFFRRRKQYNLCTQNMFHTGSVNAILLHTNYMPKCTFCLSSYLLNSFNAVTNFYFMISYYVIKKTCHVNLLLCLNYTWSWLNSVLLIYNNIETMFFKNTLDSIMCVPGKVIWNLMFMNYKRDDYDNMTIRF